MPEGVNGSHTTKKVRLSRVLVARLKQVLAVLEVERGRHVSFNAGATEAFERFAEAHETKKVEGERA